ncbi:hypothetical protein CkaCkLH20_00682 [Colletotrichum karsti]|uniref:NmrA-like domain-containing protein n=1 Tax=Colletotrichum karsti TaxID=1095194 RepID=A0A9P6LQD2_9PEZI|nr:uncharacterized protein CkaCkLH20_00682 [Colletotrichum karsti]KAF9881536.1 hypothetical protein CkaCkLH20_00682 [Colletotrichum karsti]
MLVLIAGITGSLGHRLAAVAKARGLSVRGLGRDPAKLSPELFNDLESFVTSQNYYDIPALDKAVAGVDAIICAYTPSPILDLDANLLLLRAAERANVKIFIASSWNNDWTKIKFGEFEHYDPHIAFEQQAAMTSTVKPVYIFTGVFADLLFTDYGPGGFGTSGDIPVMKYWGDGNKQQYSWTHQDDAAAWTIEILINGDGVQEGNGGFFRMRSGEHTIEELALIYEETTGTYVEGLWKMNDVVALEHVHKPTSLEQHLKEQIGRS